MIKSMTGYGRTEQADGVRNISVEIRSVNHRYCDINIHMPKRYSFAEASIKSAMKQIVQRGKIDVYLTIEHLGTADSEIVLNQELALEYRKKLHELSGLCDVAEDVSLEYLASIPDVLKSVPAVEDEEAVTNAIVSAVMEAAQNHRDMRIVEGQKMEDDIRMRKDLLEEEVSRVEERLPAVVEEYTEKLRSRMLELMGDASVNEDRLLQEAAIFADKINTTEEMVRLRSHLHQLGEIMSADQDEPVGKKLDFLVQEMNREANTTGSKANDLEITKSVLFMKSEIEKIREQVQNIE